MSPSNRGIQEFGNPGLRSRTFANVTEKMASLLVNSGGSIAYGVHIESIDRYLFQDCPALPPGATGFVAFAGVYEGFGIYSLLRNLGCKNEVIEHKVTVNYQDAKGFQYKTTGTLKITDRRMAHFEVTQFSKVS